MNPNTRPTQNQSQTKYSYALTGNILKYKSMSFISLQNLSQVNYRNKQSWILSQMAKICLTKQNHITAIFNSLLVKLLHYFHSRYLLNEYKIYLTFLSVVVNFTYVLYFFSYLQISFYEWYCIVIDSLVKCLHCRYIDGSRRHLHTRR